MKIKYNRISTSSQNLDRQQLNKNKFDFIIDEVCSGSISFFERKGSKKIINLIQLNRVSEIHTSSIDRIGRNIIDILQVSEYLQKNNVNLFVENIGIYSLLNNKPNPTFKIILSVLGSLAEIEREFLMERQKIGIEIAKLKGGIYNGRAKNTKQSNEDFIKKYQVAYNELLNGSTLKRSSLLGECSIGTTQRLKKLITSN